MITPARLVRSSLGLNLHQLSLFNDFQSNLVFLGVALHVVLSVRSRDRTRAEQMFGWLKGSATLLCLLGVTWIFGYLMVIQGAHTVFAYIFTVLNCLQGAFIFIIHVILNDKVRVTLIRFLLVHICCISDPGPGNTPSIISSRQKLINTMKNGGDLSYKSSQQCSDSFAPSSTKSENKGYFVEKTPPRSKARESPATMITYLEWKSKLSNESGSIPSDDSGNYDCEPKETRSISDEVEISASRNESERSTDWHSVTVRRKMHSNIGNESNPESSRISDQSVIVERF
ncbi:unnamed protein product [Gongylonema pulchrum]|uniref:Latrophilin Cirl n=1 Tax=Gongylonema pulchrum TaxID=637853 RepID=A0A183CX11_9BILA|nr:unnamed protein product [Gongylonema pulchrum]